MASVDDELARLRRAGLTLPRHSGRAARSYAEAVDTNNQLLTAAGHDLDQIGRGLGRTITAENYNSDDVQQMLRENASKIRAMDEKRTLSRRMDRVARMEGRTSSLTPGSPMGGDAYNAIPRFYDPLEYWDLSGLPWNVADEGHRHKLHKWLRLYYATHYLVPILIDIFTRFPLVGMELECKDPKLKGIYEDIFFDNLDYGEFLVSLGREYWCVGESFALGSFDEDLGVWEHEELINPEDIVINNFPFLNSKQLKIVPPDYLRRIAQTKSPAREWFMLMENYEDLIPYLLKGEHIPVSPVMLRQVANKLNDWDDHGTPILLRGLRTLLHEEKLLASQDAIAERLYSPLILAKLGIMDMGDGLPPWLPGSAELESVRDDLDIALSSDFRVMVHHFGLEIESVFGREQMPRLGDDFDRIERRLMQVFGVNPSLLSAGSNSQPYASSALQAEFMNQILRTFQNMLKKHYKERALVVAEAQGHQDYEMKGPQPLDAKVLTPTGWTTMGALKVGDSVIGEDGNGHSITQIYPLGTKDVYRVNFSDGSSTECTRDHAWRVGRHGKLKSFDQIHTLGEIIDADLRFPSGSLKWAIPHVQPVCFGTDHALPIDPYLMGSLLGDGSYTGDTSVAIACHSEDVEEQVNLLAHRLPIGVMLKQSIRHGNCVNIRCVRKQGIYRNALMQQLRDLEMWGVFGAKKFIPEIYLRAKIEDRIALLQGLMDTDGHINTSDQGYSVSFSTSSPSLMSGIKDLVGSLGGSTTLSTKTRRGTDEYEIRVKCLPEAITPFRLKRKADRYHPHRSGQYRHIKSVEHVGSKPVQCILVDYDRHTYITDDYIVTHNTTRVPIYERIVIFDEEGNKEIREVPKLLIPDLTFATFDLRDQATERQFLMGLRAMGVPIPNEDLLIGIDWDYKEKIGQYNRELKEQTIAQQRAKMETYIALTEQGLPVPLDLKAEVESVLVHGAGAGGGAPQGAMKAGPGGPPPGGGAGGPITGPAGGAGAQGVVMPPPPPGLGPGPGTAPPGGGAPAFGPMQPGPAGSVPQVSNERRPGLTYNTKTAKNEDGEETTTYRLAAREGSDMDQYLEDYPDLGLPFADYVLDSGAELDTISRDELNDLRSEWPQHEAAYKHRVLNETKERLAHATRIADQEAHEEAKEPAKVDEPNEEKEFVLRDNQELKTSSEGDEFILETPTKKRIRVEATHKRYALIDPLAPPLTEEEDESTPTEPESA